MAIMMMKMIQPYVRTTYFKKQHPTQPPLIITNHACRVPIVTETYDDNTIFLRQDSLVNLPAIVKVLEHIRHRRLLFCILNNMKKILLKRTQPIINPNIQLTNTKVNKYAKTTNG